MARDVEFMGDRAAGFGEATADDAADFVAQFADFVFERGDLGFGGVEFGAINLGGVAVLGFFWC